MTAPKIGSVVCGYCDTDAVRGPFGSLECPDCGRGIEARLSYADRSEEQRKEAVERHTDGE